MSAGQRRKYFSSHFVGRFDHGRQVWPFRGQKMTNLVCFILIGLEICKNLLRI